MKIVLLVLALVVSVLFLASCARKNKVDLKAGGIYSVHSGDGDFGVVKVLVLDDEAIHIRLYKNRFPQRPSTVDTSELSLGSVHDGEGNYGIGHLPIRTAEFLAWKPELVMETQRTEEELEGYEMWKTGGGGIFGQ